MKLETDSDDPATPFQRFEDLAKKLFAVPKTEVDEKRAEHTAKRKRRQVKQYNAARKP